MNEIYKARSALVAALAEEAPVGHIGRTALMKYMYFLQVLKGVPLGYSFSLYSYGPFDAEVLSDLSAAERLNIVDVTPVEFTGGYGYRIQPGAAAESAKRGARQFLKNHAADIKWLFSTFGTLNSAELELASTIIYVDRELAEWKRRLPMADFVDRVNVIKPHFSQETVQKFAEGLLGKGLLNSTVP